MNAEIIVTIDNGNSNPNWCLFQKDELIDRGPLETLDSIKKLGDQANLCLSNVGQKNKTIESALESSCYIQLNHFFSDKMFLDMPVDYTSTLGEDRLYQAYFLFKNYIENGRKEKVLLIDSGTFTTIDLISQKGMEGGLIAPGPKTLLDTFKKGANLPELKIEHLNFKPAKFANDTANAMLNSIKLMQESMMREILAKYQNIDAIFVTGGQSTYIWRLIETVGDKTHLTLSPDLLHQSLHYLASKSLSQEL